MLADLQMPMWGWWIVLYFFLGGVAGGAYFLSAVIELAGSPEDRPAARIGYFIAFPLSIVCALLLIVDLGHPERFWHMVLYSKTLLPWVNWISPISVGAYALLLFGIFSFLSFVDALVETGRLRRAPLREKYNRTPRRIYAILGGMAGFFLTAYTGQLISTTLNPIWSGTPLLGGLFAASGATTGMAAIALGMAITRVPAGSPWRKLRRADMLAMIVELILLGLFLYLLGQVAVGQFSSLTWIVLIGGVVGLGLVVPFGLYLWIGQRETRRLGTVWAIAVLTLLGGFLFRIAIIFGGQGLL